MSENYTNWAISAAVVSRIALKRWGDEGKKLRELASKFVVVSQEVGDACGGIRTISQS